MSTKGKGQKQEKVKYRKKSNVGKYEKQNRSKLETCQKQKKLKNN